MILFALPLHGTVYPTRVGVLAAFAIALNIVISACAPNPNTNEPPIRLTTEFLTNPIGLDAPHPRLAWVLRNSRRAEGQSAYRIEVWTSARNGGANRQLVWDSGVVFNRQQMQIAYSGRDLRSGLRYYWRVQTWDLANESSGWSQEAYFETGLMRQSDWLPSMWVAANGLVRGTIDLATRPKRGRLYVSARGNYERGPDGLGTCCREAFGLARGIYDLEVNGHDILARLLDPSPVDTRIRALYSTYDVTDLLSAGANAIGIMLGEDSDVRILLRVDLPDAEQVVFGTNMTWKTTVGPVTRANRYEGEAYDARQELPGWSAAQFDVSAWPRVRDASLVPGATNPLMWAAAFEPTSIVETRSPTSIRCRDGMTYVVDFGHDISGWSRITAQGASGTTIQLHYGEELDADGHVSTSNIAAAQTDRYTMKGEGLETWEPAFVYHGFRYVEVSGYPGLLRPGNIVAREVHTDVALTGSFSSSSPALDRIQEAIRQTQLNALQGIPVDSPTREKRGWLADAHLTAEEASDNFGVAALYAQFVTDILDAQYQSGLVPDFVPSEPSPPWRTASSDTAWGAAVYLLPWGMFVRYGNKDLLREAYPAIQRWLDYVASTSRDFIVDHPSQDWGDDYAGTERTPGALFRTAFYFDGAVVSSKTAQLLNKPADAARYAVLADSIKAALNAAFLRRTAWGCHYANDSQFADALPLVLQIVPADCKTGVLNSLVEDVRKAGGHLTGGFLGIKYIVEALQANDRSDVVYRAVTETTEPGWIYMLDHGPGTIWEWWDGSTSRDNPALGSIGSWFYEGLAGIAPDPVGPGYARSIIRPQALKSVSWVRARLSTPFGVLASGWRHVGSRMIFDLQIPVNTSATVILPAPNADVRISESGASFWLHGRQSSNIAGVRIRGFERGRGLELELGSGSYEFWVDPSSA